VGCSCVPSPALMTFDSMRSARKRGAPEAGCRMTTMSIFIASRFRAVSTRVSPFDTLETAVATLTVSADIRFSANSKEMRVRVEASKKRFTTVIPRSVGTFLMARSEIALRGSATSRIAVICSRESPSRPMRSLPRRLMRGPGRGRPRRGRRGSGRRRRPGPRAGHRRPSRPRRAGSGARVRHGRRGRRA